MNHRVWVYGDNVNTDLIFPGKYTYTLRTQGEIAAHALEDLDPAFAGSVQPGDAIVAGWNWGCGSSREQGVTALKWAGITAIVAASFGGLYFRNCINQGIRPIVCPGVADLLHTGDEIEITRHRNHRRRSALRHPGAAAAGAGDPRRGRLAADAATTIRQAHSP